MEMKADEAIKYPCCAAHEPYPEHLPHQRPCPTVERRHLNGEAHLRGIVLHCSLDTFPEETYVVTAHIQHY